MGMKSIQDVLPLVEQPSRYLGTEINSIHKDHDLAKLKFLFAFPDRYEVGTSHFGIQILYSILNSVPEIVAERVFAPATDFKIQLNKKEIPLGALESGRPIGEFDIIGFSLLYELNYTNILGILELGRIPFRAIERESKHPIIIGGGPCTCNPEPLADFFDAFVIGDGERTLLDMACKWLAWKKEGDNDRTNLLNLWSELDGVYIPSFYKPIYDDFGFQSLIPREKRHSIIKRVVFNDLDQAPFPEKPIIPFGKPIHDRLRLEVSRGCTRGCRFCQAGIIYRPVRERQLKTLLEIAKNSLSTTGYEDLSLLSLSTSDYGCLGPLLEKLILAGKEDHVAISFPSFRAGTMSADLMTLIKKVRKTGFTIAAEAGSQRLRNVINKNIIEEDIVSTVSDAFSLGWQVIKLYFMIGLPTEKDEDILEMVALIKRLLMITRKKGKNGRINISVNTFIPKPHTPFQWAKQLPIKESIQITERLRSMLNLPRLHFKWQNPETSILEGVWARGDRRLGRLLETAYRMGCCFDGWSDMFQYNRWVAAAEQTGISFDFFTTRERKTDEPLPWDHIATGVKKEFLEKEWKQANKEETTPDCRDGNCQKCGACDFENIFPRVHSCLKEPISNEPLTNDKEKDFRPLNYKFVYSKLGPARFFGHLEMVNIFMRALKRAGIKVNYSEGFHPMPKISFEDPLPLGTESEAENFFIKINYPISTIEVREKLNKQLPDGLKIMDVILAPIKNREPKEVVLNYLIDLKDGFFDEDKLLNYFSETPPRIVKRNKKGKERIIDFSCGIRKMAMESSKRLSVAILKQTGNFIRPADILSYIFEFNDEIIQTARVKKLRSDSH